MSQTSFETVKNKACEFEAAELTHLVNEQAEDEHNAVIGGFGRGLIIRLLPAPLT